MAEQKVWIGSLGPFLYDDSDPINDIDGDLTGATYGSLSTTGQLNVNQNPTDPMHVLRQSDVGSAAAQSYVEGSFNATYNGFTTPPNPVWRYIKFGKLITLQIQGVNSPSNATTFTISGLPSLLYPARTCGFILPVLNNGQYTLGFMDITSAGVITMYIIPQSTLVISSNTWSATGNKGIYTAHITYNQIL